MPQSIIVFVILFLAVSQPWPFQSSQIIYLAISKPQLVLKPPGHFKTSVGFETTWPFQNLSEQSKESCFKIDFFILGLNCMFAYCSNMLNTLITL